MGLFENIIKNPFKGIIKTNEAPHNRTLRTDFLRKLKDAFVIFYGAPCKGKLGVLDYCTLGIPFFMHRLAHKLNTPFTTPLGVFLNLFHFILLHSLKSLIAAILVFNPVSLIVIVAVQLIAKYLAEGKKLQEQALSLRLTNEKEEKITLENELLAIPDYDKFGVNKSWEKTDFSLETLRIGFNKEMSQLVVKQVIFPPECLPHEKKYYGDSFCYLPVFQDDKIIKHGKNISALKALIALNVGNVTENLEKTPEGIDMLKNIMAAPAA